MYTNFASASEHAAAVRIAQAPPVSFTLGGVPFPTGFERVGENSFLHAASGLKVTLEAALYGEDSSAVEWTPYFENTGSADTPVIADVRALDYTVPMAGGAWIGTLGGVHGRADDFAYREAPITAAEYKTSTGLEVWPDFLKKDVDKANVLQCKANGEFTYALRGVHAKVCVEWRFMAPKGTGDTHYSLMRGTKSEIVIRQGPEEGYKPRVYVKPRAGQDKAALEKALAAAVAQFGKTYPGVTYKAEGDGWAMVVPQKYEIGHEAHFSQVMNMYLGWMKKGEQPADYLPNMLVKYYTITEAWKASRATNK